MQDNRYYVIAFAVMFMIILFGGVYTFSVIRDQGEAIDRLTKSSIVPTPDELSQLISVTTTPSVSQDPMIITPTPRDQVTTKVKLYYKVIKNDPSVVNCEADTFVYREIPLTKTPLKDTLTLLLSNELTEDERKKGLIGALRDSEKSPANFKLISVLLENGKAKLTFQDPDNYTTGGSCRVGIMQSQIEKTAKQFDPVKSVEFLPELLFQP